MKHASDTKNEQPLDWIYCPDGRMKAVVACMANCKRRCDAFWLFFRKIQKTPREYYNKDNLGELCMRRVVFDCDRCGKKDIGKAFSRYQEDAYPEEKVLDKESKAALLEDSDFLYDDLGESFFSILQLIEREKNWRHFCHKCFHKVLSSWAAILEIKHRGRKVLSDSKVAHQSEIASKKPRLKKVTKRSQTRPEAA